MNNNIVSKVNRNADSYHANYQHHGELAQQLRGRITEAVSGGRDHLIERHRRRGKLLPRERIDLLVDPCTPFLEFSRSPPTDSTAAVFTAPAS